MHAKSAFPGLPTPIAANDDIRRQPLRAAILSARPARFLAVLKALDIIAVDAARTDLALLLRDVPDLLVVDIEPGTVSTHRLALLVAQLGWARRDLVIAVAQGRTAALGGLAAGRSVRCAEPSCTFPLAPRRYHCDPRCTGLAPPRRCTPGNPLPLVFWYRRKGGSWLVCIPT
jgi:hypothetical protein